MTNARDTQKRSVLNETLSKAIKLSGGRERKGRKARHKKPLKNNKSLKGAPTILHVGANGEKSPIRELEQTARTAKVCRSLTDETINNFFESLDSPKSLACYLLYTSKEHQQLVDLECDPHHYNDAYSFRDDFAAVSLLKKADFLTISEAKQRKDKAIQKFLKAEADCKVTNERLRNLDLDPSYNGVNAALLHAMQRKIVKVLGLFSPEEFVASSNWGPGVTNVCKGQETSSYNKFAIENGVTRGLYSFIEPWFDKAYPGWSNRLDAVKGEKRKFSLESGNTVTTVPKNAKIDRVIAVEPGINSWFQKGVGAMIRKRLRAVHINLNSQRRNQQLSKQGSLTGELATIDFAAASDTISNELIFQLFKVGRPAEVLGPWYDVMSACRCSVGILGGSFLKWEKFSSMGNGFTFELESLVFYAAAFATCEHLGLSTKDVSVYGDDVILPNDAAQLFTTFSNFLGFTVNLEKSFSSSYFRESCGDYYYEGVCVKPIYLKERVNNVEGVYKLANNVRALAHRRNSHYGCDRSFFTCWRGLFLGLPKSLRLRTPEGKGNCGFTSNLDEAMSSEGYGPHKARDGIEGYTFRALIRQPISRIAKECEAFALSRYRINDTNQDNTLGDRRTDQPNYLRDQIIDVPPVLQTETYANRDQIPNLFTLREKTRLVIKDDLHVSFWYNFGPWI